MKTFLSYVATDILNKWGDDLSQLTIVFPNKRASLFLNECLAQQSDRPIWSPRYITISELFRERSTMQVADNIKLVCDLHKCYTETTGIVDTLDHFYGWGQLMLSDFDDIDKNMAEARQLFTNLEGFHEMDDVSYLTAEQTEALMRFFSNFSADHNSMLKQRFLKLWQHLGDIYQSFRRRLADQQLAYEGMLYRQVVEQMEETTEGEEDAAQYVFVGFNVLQKVEQRLFTILQKQKRAHFYWDFDKYYMNGNEAGHFIAQYLADFPNELDSQDDDIYNQFARPRTITLASATTENQQARFATQWLRQEHRKDDGIRSAIVLCDEQLLPTLIHSLPPELQSYNITTGYPLGATPASSFITHLVNLQTVGYSPSSDTYRLRHVLRLLSHPYAVLVSPKATSLREKLLADFNFHPTTAELTDPESGCPELFMMQKGLPSAQLIAQWLARVVEQLGRASRHLDQMAQEAIFRAHCLINRIVNLIDAGDLTIDEHTLVRLLTQLLQTTTIPFHGSPVEGVQLMGTLETRNLDFRHLLILSCNEGNMPKGISDTSFIPYAIRKAFGLTTIDHKVAIYSYYFHRMLQRADDITILYNSAMDNSNPREMSRFILQLLVESPHKIIRKKLGFEETGDSSVLNVGGSGDADAVEGNSAASQISDKTLEVPRLLSPSALSVYLRCPRRFYYRYVEHLKEPDNTDVDDIDNRHFGNIFHDSARRIYSRLCEQNNLIDAPRLQHLLRERVTIEQAVDDAINSDLYGSTKRRHRLSGLQQINREVIILYLRRLLKADLRLAPFKIIMLEQRVESPITIRTSDGQTLFETNIGGIIDRLDQVGNTIRVVDYKTGAKGVSQGQGSIASIDDIFDSGKIENHSDYFLQAILYALLVQHSDDTCVSPALLFIQHAGKENYDPTLAIGRQKIADVEPMRERFMSHINQLSVEIFSPDNTFQQTEYRKRCENCPYRMLCQ